MKPIIRQLWIVMAMLCFPIYASAYDFEVDGIYYNVNSTEDFTCSVTSGDKKYSGDVVIPQKVKNNNVTYTVTMIGYDAFYRCSSLTSITLPNSLTAIGGDAFYGCSSLTSVTLPNSLTAIGNSTFGRCTSLTSVTLPNSLTTIGIGTFLVCNYRVGKDRE